MIVKCPNCGAGFQVRAEALGMTGRTVRCSSCRFQWLARADAAALAGEAPAPPPPPPPVETAPEIVPPPEPAPPAVAEAPEFEPARDGPVPLPPAPAVLAPPRRAGAIAWVVLAIVLVVLAIAIAMREQVMSSLPWTRPLFAAFGFRVPGVAEGLLIVDVRPTWSRNPADGQPMLVIDGRVNNVSDGPREIPPLRGMLRDGPRVVHSWTFNAAPARLASGQGVDFRTEVRPPPGAGTVAIVFAATSEAMARILVAEDEDAVRAFVVRALEHAGHSVAAVADGGVAVEALGRERFDLLVTDIVMPQLDGIALALKATKDWPAMGVLLMTGFAAERQRAHNLEALIHRVLAKPFTMGDLLAAVDETLERRLAT